MSHRPECIHQVLLGRSNDVTQCETQPVRDKMRGVSIPDLHIICPSPRE